MAGSSLSCARTTCTSWTSTGHERALTTDGHAQRLNGKLDWVYQEEIYGRGTHRAYWWSPDSSRLAFLQLDEAPVPEFTVVDHIPYRQDVEVTDYPKAGDPNPTVKLGVVRAAGGDVQWVDTSKYGAAEHLIVDVGWTPDSKDVVYQVQDREQTWLDLNLGDAAKGTTRTLFRETTKAWVSVLGPPTWLKDGSFLWLSERDGWQHLYRYKRDGTAVGRVTSGKWEFDELYGVDESRRRHLLRRHRAQPHRPRHLPGEARRHRADAAVGARGHAQRDASTRPSRTTSAAGATSTRRRRCGCTRPTAPRSA